MPSVLSLFTGTGGLDIGFHEAGFDIVACVEIDGVFCETLRKNSDRISGATIHNMDINDYIKKPEIWPENVDFIIGGPPCQPFSAGGRRAGGAPGKLDQIRGTLYESYATLVEKIRPKGFLFENVKGILNSNGGDDWQKINSAFESIGYTLSYQVIDAAEYGVPQHRERVILIGIENRNISFKWPAPTHGPKGKQEYITAHEAIIDLEFIDDGTEIKGKYTDLIPNIPEGDNYSFFTLNRKHPNPVFGWRSRFSGFLYKASSKRPVKTLLANPGGWGGPFHWENRRMTISELKRLQSIPDYWEICGSRSRKIRQIGNSVPPILANVLAKSVNIQLFEGTNKDIDLVSSIVSDKNSRKARLATITRSRTIKPQDIKNRITEARGLEKRSIANRSQEFESLFSHALGGSLTTNHNSTVCDFILNGLNGNIRLYGNHRAELSLSKNGLNYTTEEFLIHSVFLATPLKIGSFEIYQLQLKMHRDIELPVIHCWDILNQLVSAFTSFPSLLQFYGHFTEPHSQFEFEFENLEIIDQWDAHLQLHLSQTWELNENINTSELQLISTSEVKDSIQLLLDNRIDIRTQKMNPQIPTENFRICYPFPLPIGTKTSIPNAPSIRGKGN